MEILIPWVVFWTFIWYWVFKNVLRDIERKKKDEIEIIWSPYQDEPPKGK